MPFLQINGTTVEISEAGASERARTAIGSSTRAFAGNTRSSKRAEKREWQFTTGPMSQSALGSLRTQTELGQLVTVDGDAIGGPVTAEVVIGDAPYMADASDASDFKRSATLTITEA